MQPAILCYSPVLTKGFYNSSVLIELFSRIKISRYRTTAYGVCCLESTRFKQIFGFWVDSVGGLFFFFFFLVAVFGPTAHPTCRNHQHWR